MKNALGWLHALLFFLIPLTDKFIPFLSFKSGPLLLPLFVVSTFLLSKKCLQTWSEVIVTGAPIYAIPLVAYIVHSLIYGPLDPEQLSILLREFVKFPLLFVCLGITLRARLIPEKAFDLFLLLCGIAAVLSLTVYLPCAPNDLTVWTDSSVYGFCNLGVVNSYPRIQFLFSEPAKFAQFLLVPLTLAIARYVFAGRRGFYLLLSALFIIAIALTQSAQVILALLVVGFLFVVRQQRMVHAKVLVLASIFFLVLVTGFAIHYVFVEHYTTFGVYSRASSFAERLKEVMMIPRNLDELPFGLGIPDMGSRMISKDGHFFVIQNSLTRGILTLGWVFVAYFTLLVGFTLNHFFGPDSRKSYWAGATLLAILSSLTYGPLESRGNLFIFAFFFFCAARTSVPHGLPSSDEPHRTEFATRPA